MSTQSSRTSPAADVRAHAHPAGAAAAPAAAGDRFMQIPVGQIDPSPTNFRRDFKPDALQELAGSILMKGVVEPIIVRPKLSAVARNAQQQKVAEGLGIAGEPRYEIVAGERRWRATKLAGVKTIPAIVRDYSDNVALEIQIIENDQREDLTPMERAAGFRMMLDRLGYSAEQIAAKLHKSKTFVYSHLKLAELPKAAVESLEKGVEAGGISRSVAELIGRIADAKQRDKAAREIIKGDYRGAPMSFRTAQEHVARNYMRELKGAPFSLDDPALVAEAGSCAACPHRSGNTPEEYQGKRPDICLSPACFAKKVDAHHDLALASYRERGHTVLSAAEVKEAFPYGGHSSAYNSKYVSLAATCYEDSRQRTYAQMVGADYKAIIARAPDGTVMQLALKPDVKKLIEKAKPAGSAVASNSSRHAAPTPQRHKPDPAVAIHERANEIALARLTQKALAGGAVVPLGLMRFLALDAIDLTSESDEIAAARGVEFKVGQSEAALRKFVAGATMPQLVSLLVEVHYRETYGYGAALPNERKELLALYKIDFEAIKRDVKRERDEWEMKLKTATTKDVIKVEVEPSRLVGVGDIADSYSAKQIADGKPVKKPFEHEGEMFISVGGMSGAYEHALRLVPRSSYKRKTYRYGEKSGTEYEGTRVTYQGGDYVLTGPKLKCVPAGAAKKGAGGKAKR